MLVVLVANTPIKGMFQGDAPQFIIFSISIILLVYFLNNYERMMSIFREYDLDMLNTLGYQDPTDNTRFFRYFHYFIPFFPFLSLLRIMIHQDASIFTLYIIDDIIIAFLLVILFYSFFYFKLTHSILTLRKIEDSLDFSNDKFDNNSDNIDEHEETKE
jgi:hypothetical protein